MDKKKSDDSGSGTVEGSSYGALRVIVILIVLVFLGQWAWDKYFPPATDPAKTERSADVPLESQQILELVPGDSIQWVNIPRGMCSEANPAQGCVDWFINNESTQVRLCRGVPVNVPGPSFRAGFSADQKTSVAVDLFPCNK